MVFAPEKLITAGSRTWNARHALVGLSARSRFAGKTSQTFTLISLSLSEGPILKCNFTLARLGWAWNRKSCPNNKVNPAGGLLHQALFRNKSTGYHHH